jgi:uncharacterized protein YodC (DUF2158 family)
VAEKRKFKPGDVVLSKRSRRPIIVDDYDRHGVVCRQYAATAEINTETFEEDELELVDPGSVLAYRATNPANRR